MDYPTLLLLISFIWTIFFFFISNKISRSSKKYSLKLPPPPGPRTYPIIGNMLEFISNDPLQSFTNLSKIYGPIISVKLGTITTIVISSSKIAKQVLHTNDMAFSSRTIPDTIRALNHYKVSVAWLPACDNKWRALRRACATKIFSPQKLDATQFLRKEKVQELLDYVHECCNKGEAFDFDEAIFTTVLNSISNTLFSKNLFHYHTMNDHKSREEFKEIIFGVVEEAGRPNIADFFPFLRLLDPQGARKMMASHYAKLFRFIDGIIEERVRLRAQSSDSKKCNDDVLHSFLNLIEEESNSQLSRNEVIHLFGDLFVAGIDTTSCTLVWAMTELLRNPKKLARAKEELHQIYDKLEQFDESKIARLPYLNAIVKETLRLHPPAPFLLPHKSNDDVELAGFKVPKNAQILINVWSIGRDSNIWVDPNSFEPERFLRSEIDFKGKDFELIPFGSGRRICPGLHLASRSIHFVLASLLYHFDWKLGDGVKPEDVDMSQKFGIVLHKAQPLRVVPVKV